MERNIDRNHKAHIAIVELHKGLSKSANLRYFHKDYIVADKDMEGCKVVDIEEPDILEAGNNIDFGLVNNLELKSVQELYWRSKKQVATSRWSKVQI